jgi:hypothetical protein
VRVYSLEVGQPAEAKLAPSPPFFFWPPAAGPCLAVA